MNLDDQTRTLFHDLTEDVVGGPDLASAIADGRRHRRVRRTAWAGAGVVVALVSTIAGVSLAEHRSAQAVDPATHASAAYHDFVAGTDIDETMQATVGRHLPDLSAATAVYPSDWNTPGPIADSDFAQATEWHAVYQVSGTEKLTVVMSQPVPGQPASTTCDNLEQADIPCRREVLSDGSVEIRSGYLLGTSTYRFMSVRVTPDGFVIETLDDVVAASVAEADASRQVTDAQTSSLVRDPGLAFPAPVPTPPSPKPQQ